MDIKADFGAVGDDIADDGPAFQRAFDSLDEGAKLNVPPGVYRIATPVARSFGASAPDLITQGCGSASQIRPDLDANTDCFKFDNLGGTPALVFRDLAFIGPGAGHPIQCNRALALIGSDYGRCGMENLTFAGVKAADSVAMFGTGSNHWAENLNFIGCDCVANENKKNALLDFDIVYGARARNIRMISTGFFNGLALPTAGAHYGIKFRPFEVPFGFNNTAIFSFDRVTISGNFFQGIGCIQQSGTPNGPCSPVFNEVDFSKPIFAIQASGAPICSLPSEGEIRIDSTGVPGVMTWSYRWAPISGSFTGYMSAGNATSANIDTTGINIAFTGSDTYSAGSLYRFYITGPMRNRLVKISSSSIQLATYGYRIAETDHLILEQCHFDSPNPSNAVDLWDCGDISVCQCDFGIHTIAANASDFGFGSNKYLYVEDTIGAVSSHADRTVTSTRGLVTITPPF